MEIGKHIRFDDGREATVVFNGLIGVGIKWGLHDPDINDFEGSSGGLFDWTPPDNFQWEPEALLRSPSHKYPGLFEKYGFPDEVLVGNNYEIIE